MQWFVLQLLLCREIEALLDLFHTRTQRHTFICCLYIYICVVCVLCLQHLTSDPHHFTDSILFPDVPIALRLSSHLLLGVVRIYSRKVNYLFDDCSEALLKIKQAFRSTAVDLPPEESTAPYHSITLPETFDLDDFELPDNDLFQGLVPC